MDVTLLTRTELSYELTARGYKNVEARTVPEMRKIITRCLKSETVTGPQTHDDIDLDPTTEIDICTAKLTELKDTEIKGTEQSLEYRRFFTKIAHLLGRIARIKIDNADLIPIIRKLRDDVINLEKRILESIPPNGTDNDVPIATPTVTEPTPKRKQIPVSQWGLTFSGDNDQTSIGAFLERVEEFRISRNLTSEELFNSAVELLRGSALIWFRAIKTEIHTWEELAHRLRQEFESYDYEHELWKEIRARTQGPQERVGPYFACMVNLFARLPRPATDDEKLAILRRNMAPYFIHHTGLLEFTSVEQLRDTCKRLEANRARAENFQPPPTNKRKLLEPDLACQSQSRPAVTRLEGSRPPNISKNILCWNCRKPGHLYSVCRAPRTKFCYSCGTVNQTKASCPKCQSLQKN